MSKFYFQPVNDRSSVSSTSHSPYPPHDSPTLNFPTPPSQNIQNINSRDLMRLYLRDIGRIRLLSKEEEITLARQIQTAQSLHQIKEQNDSVPELREYIRVMSSYDSLAGHHSQPPTVEIMANKLSISVPVLQKIILEGKQKWASLANLTIEELDKTLADGIKAKQMMIKANLRLVVSIAKKYQNRGLELLDLIQEGTLGLEKAVEKFDYTKGYHFSTYSYWWIRQGMTRAIATQGRTIRIPIHITERLNLLKKVQRQLSQTLGRMATVDEIAQKMNMTAPQLRQFLNQIPRSISLEMKVGEDYNTELVELIEAESDTPEENLMRVSMQQDLQLMMSSLNEREQKILRLRFGFENGKIYSLSDTASMMNLSRERVRQIQAKAIQKLRQPNQEKQLRDYLEIINS
ncbi:RNA polymerase sigma factor, RpoD/SigA family [Geminocystis sp. NIES-3709]|uniref:RNA polymerase sigma factor, RpoD/SigA family n=1 Tax=Geminocystis sp. NIES-3709 TaxID=1617448 RepID=UPI0005FC4E59|nr:RNA polymerase sigma factor, RpoD/SigA family [Geminocystis sp. NIES-3709]BAQ66853.1 group 2 RNA polymerase sigma factor [Geminocystis sp. NIES-3709]